MEHEDSPRRPTTMHRVERGDKTGPALLVPSSTIRDENLTPDALYLLLWMLDHPTTWNFQKGYVWENSKLSRNRMYAAIKLLRELRYCFRRGTVDEKGHKSYVYEWFAAPYASPEESALAAVTSFAEVIPESGTLEQDAKDKTPRGCAPAGRAPDPDTDGVVLHSLSVPDPGSRNQGSPLVFQSPQPTEESGEVAGQLGLDRSSGDYSATVTNPLQKKSPQRNHADSRTDLICRLGRCEDPQGHGLESDKSKVATMTSLANSA